MEEKEKNNEEEKEDEKDEKEELNKLNEKLALTTKEKEIESMNFNNQKQRLVDDYERRLKNAENKTTDNEEKSKQAERKLITIKAQYDKEKEDIFKSIDINSSNDCSHELESIQTLKIETLG